MTDVAARGGADARGVWRSEAIAIDPHRILRLHRYTDMQRVRPVIREAAALAAGRAADLCRPEARYRQAPIVGRGAGVLTLQGGAQLHCAAFDHLLAGCTEVVAFVLTLGSALDATVIGLIDDQFEPLDALFLETAGWLMVEAATRQLTLSLRRELEPRGYRITLRMGPGYEYRSKGGENGSRVRWPLEDQPQLFRLLEGGDLPVELLSSCAMRPKMSRSGLFGLAPSRAT